jgi:hypothetical protein
MLRKRARLQVHSLVISMCFSPLTFHRVVAAPNLHILIATTALANVLFSYLAIFAQVNLLFPPLTLGFSHVSVFSAMSTSLFSRSHRLKYSLNP